jgi:lysophospholipase L1-like esterase
MGHFYLLCKVKLKLDFDINPNPISANWPSFFLMGSCFATNQGVKLTNAGFGSTTNPFGIIYNPVSMATLLYRIAKNKTYLPEDFIQHGKHFSLEHHGDFKYDTLQEAINKSNAILFNAQQELSKANVVVLTFGTSLVFHHILLQKIVGNCHTLPNKDFEVLQLHFETVKNTIQNCIKSIREINENAHIVLTVSPVRHIKSGVVNNSRSKANLIAALHEALAEENNASYFPAFEIFIDELRDYRFAKEDLTHPTDTAVDYIYERFTHTYFSKSTNAIAEEVVKFQRFAAHRPMSSPDLHLTQVAEKRKELKQKYPFLHI